MTIHKMAMKAFRETMHPHDNTIPDELLSNAMTAAFQYMYTDRRVAGLALDPNTGEVFAAMTDGRCAKYSPDDMPNNDVPEDQELTWSWKPVPPIPGTIAAGGRLELEGEKVSCSGEYYMGMLNRLQTALANLENMADMTEELALPIKQLQDLYQEMRPDNDAPVGGASV